MLLGSLLAATSPAQVIDTFDRSDASDIGNGWIEKSPAAFAVNAGAVEKAQVGSSYRDNVVFRPASENLLNVETSVEFTLDSLPPRYPQLFARIQTDTALAADSLDAYILYIANSSQNAVLGRQRGGAFVTALANVAIAPALNGTDTYRLRLNVAGTNPVNITAAIERFNGTGWDTIGQATVADNSAQRISTAGSVGFGGSHWEDQYRYDNFSRTDLGGSNPQPVLTSIDPNAADVGDPGFTLTVNGSSFIQSSVVRWNGNARPTTFVSANQLTADIPSSDLAAAGQASVDVETPGPGGGISQAQTFTVADVVVDNPVPQVSSLSPSSTDEGGPAFQLTVLGSDFVSASVVRWNGADRPTTFVSATELVADIPAADIQTDGTATVTVASPAPGGGVSTGLTFTIDPVVNPNPAPTLTAIAPSSADQNGNAFTLTAFGANFIGSSVVRWNGADRATTFVSAGELSAQIPASDLAAAGTATVTVATPGPGGGISGGQTFTIVAADNPVPQLASISPSAATEGDPAFTLTVTGADFVPSSIVRWDGANRPTTYVSPSQLTADISAADIDTAGTATVDVFSPAPGGGVSASTTFTILQPSPDPTPVPSVSGIWPVAADEGSAQLSVTIFGDYFGDFSQGLWDGEARPTYYRSDRELLLLVTEADLATAGSATIAVVNPAPGGGTSNALTFAIDPMFGNPVAPTLTGVSPGTREVGAGGATLTITGENFTLDSVVNWNGAQQPTVFLSDQTLQATLPASAFDTAQVATVTVSTPAPGGGTSQPQTFIVYEPNTSAFIDNFNRGESDAIGNGWTEKFADAFALFNGEAVSRETAFDYKDNVIYRPLAEDRRDVELSVEFRRTSTSENLPQLHARLQRDTVAQPQTMDSYIFFINDIGQPPIEAAIAVQAAESWTECFISAFSFPSELQFDERYRLRFRVTGDVPVQLAGFVDHWNGQSWDVFASGSTVHDYTTQADPNLFCSPGYMLPPIPQAGATGVSKYYNRTDAYDNFYWRDYGAAPGQNPVPVLNGVTPSTATAGDGDLQITVDGSGFVPGAVVRWNGATRQTGFASSSQLTAVLTAADLSQPTTGSVTVFNPGPGGGESNAQPFVVEEADPGPGPGPGPAVFDNFDRPNSPSLGNGWIEKSPAAFSLVNGAVAKQSVATGYRDNVVYRPATENTLNSETSLEFQLLSVGGYPQIFTRIQTQTAGTANAVTGYILYIANSATNAVMGRQSADNFVSPLANITLSAPLNTTDRYRMRLSAQNSTPVDVAATIERWNGTGWDVIGQASAQDAAGARITGPGAAGFGGHVEANYLFDNFDVQSLDP